MVVTSVLTLFALGLVAAAVLAVASQVFYVEEDPRVEAVLEALPGANCGGCGYAGCEGYAQAVVQDPNVPASLCVAGGSDVSVAVGDLTGKTVAAAEPLVSFRRCEKVAGHVAHKYAYQGMPSCAAVTMLSGGNDECSYSCVGFGDCEVACPFDAIEVVDRMAHVNTNKCTGCGVCVKACPKNVLELIPARARVSIFCSTKEKMRAVMDVCEAGCINCGKCVKSCPAHVISNESGRIEINHTLCVSFGPECGEACVNACPRHILRVLGPGSAQTHVAQIKSEKSSSTQAQADA